MFQFRLSRAFATVAFSLTALGAYAQHQGDVWVGRSADPTPKILHSGYDISTYYQLPPVSGILHGWSYNSPGFDHLVLNAPPIYTLQSGASIWFRVIRFTPAFRVIDNSFHIINSPGQQTLLGNESLHTHLVWHINDLDPAYDPDRWLWKATFELVDQGSTGYLSSGPLTMYFTNVECQPGDVNGDGTVNPFDIQPFINALTGTATTEQKCASDTNRDGSVNPFDIQPFIELLLG